MKSNKDGKSAEMIYDASHFSDAHDKPSVLVPIVRATAETLDGYGNMVPDYESEHVTRVTWPKTTGWRPLASGTGNHQVRVTSLSSSSTGAKTTTMTRAMNKIIKLTIHYLWPPYVIGQAIYIFILWFLLLYSFFFLFFPRLISAVGDWMSTVPPHMVWS